MTEKRHVRAGKYLMFSLNGQSFGVPVEQVREILRMAEVTEVPQTPKFVAGVMNLRGKIIPVVSLRMKLGFPESERSKHTCIVVVESQEQNVGMIVDAVSTVIELSAEQIEPDPLKKAGGDSAVVGMGKWNNQVLILIDISKCLADLESITELGQAMHMDRSAS